ncbi:hypothetical protein [Streptomyces sp. CMB-StM0423]|uniref:hypothetical protein n=1 Tax=Streptomyces sp. CMB-StM0423 TaxID=2059884 RepID=UPI000C7135A3|nr:hypothetical protein [Streptomyces sp. CMB-StM0423]AUH41009.1 hypothetical protein CXR04_12750 [Streptomyces sp. CMB-StM0423]
MVDDRYGWLDEDVAERLLRGEPLDFADGNGRRGRKRWSPEDRAAAERLAAVLARVAESGRPGKNGRVPGEQAALAAFRAAQESPSPASAAEFAAESPFDGRRGRRRSGVVERLRSLRLSVVGAVAACALGGVAVASSAGVLPAPSFIQDTGGNRSPSVGATSSAETPDGEKEDGSAAEGGKGSDKDGKDKESGKDGKDPGDEGRGADTDLPGRGVIGDVRGNEPPNMANADAVLDELCRDYLAAQAGTGPMPGQGRLRVLEQAAGSPAAMSSYCSNRLGTSAGTPGGATGGGTGGSSGGSTGGDSEEPTSPSPSPTDPGTDPGGSTGGSSGSGGSGGETGGGDTDGGSESGGSQGPPQEGPSPNPGVNVSESPAPEPSATATAAEPEESAAG